VPDDQDAVIKELLTADGTPDRRKLRDLLGVKGNEPTRSWSVVLTVPDPLHTRRSLLLDEQIETVERSLQAAGWDFANQWLPWGDQFNAGEGDIEKRRKQRRLLREQAELPGVLLFRSQREPDDLFSVFVVPETATAGINGPAFFAAMHMASALTTAPQIGLLASTFSGSLPSLGRLVKGWNGRLGPDHLPLAPNVYSGSVSNSHYAEDFRDSLRVDQKQRPEFYGGTANTDDYLDVACDVMQWYDIDPQKEAVILHEDESGLSSGVNRYLAEKQQDLAKQQCVLPSYVFPRDISHLRNAYQETETPVVRDPYGPQSPNLNFSIRDPNSGEDSIPAFSNVQTPLTQDAVLSSIVGELNRRNTRVVIISAANVLDTLFLMRVIRQQSPNTRIMIESPNALMIAAAAREGAAGTILLSTYPMFADGEEWLDGESARDRLRFGDSNLQGLYNVSQLLLLDLGALIKPDSSPDLRAYRVFKTSKGGRHYPGLWVLMLNRFGFAPLRLEERKWMFRDKSNWLRPYNDATLPELPSGIDKPVRGWQITVLLVNAGIVAWCFMFVWCNVAPEKRRPLWLAVLTPTSERLQALVGVCLSMTLLNLILLSPALRPLGSFLWPGDGWVRLLHWFALFGLAAPTVTLGFLTWLLVQRRSARRERPAEVEWHEQRFALGWGDALFLSVTLGVFATVLYAWLASCYGLFSNRVANTRIEQFFFRYRAMDPYSGSSPSPPLLLLSVILLCIAVLHFERYTLAGRGRPLLKFVAEEEEEPAEIAAAKTEGDLGGRAGERARIFHGNLGRAQHQIEEQVRAPASLPFRTACGRAALGICLVALCWVVLGRYHWQAFELGGFNVGLAAGMSLVLFCLAMECFDLFALWKRLQKMLRLLEYLPLEPALERVTREWPRRPIWAFRKAVAHERVARQMLYALHGRRMTLETETAKQADPSAKPGASSGWPSGIETTPEQAKKDVTDFVEVTEAGNRQHSMAPLKDILHGRRMPGADARLKEQQAFERKSAKIADCILRRDLRPSWRHLGTDEIFGRGHSGDESPEERYDRFCADFLALHCSRYVAYCMEHIQRIASCISVSFLLLLVFFNSYSPQSPQMVARFLAVLFLAIGYVIVRVFAEMERNPFLSRMSRTKPGELNRGFWVQLLTLGGLPLLGVLAHLFPAISQFLFRWIAPGVQAMQ
jgi:hypothetical protein